MSACIVWKKARNKFGYGKRYYKGRVLGAHRVAFFEAHGYWPFVCRHTCDNPPCVNPAHLLDGDYADNARDAVERGRASGGSMPGARNPNAKLSEGCVAKIRAALAHGAKQTHLAKHYRISQQMISCIARRENW